MFYMLARKYHDYDMTVYYRSGDEKQIERLRQLIPVKCYIPGEKIVCERAFFNYNTDIIDMVEAKEYYEIIHADFYTLNKLMSYLPNTHPKITHYIAVSQAAANGFEMMTGIKPEVCYNPLIVDKPKKVLKLITASRLTKEKGKDRMIKLAHALDISGVPYIWTVFTNDTNAIDSPNVAYMKPRLDILDFVAEADYLVQLSDTEAYSYSLIESLTLGTPVIVTPLPVLDEMGIKDRVNSFVLPFDMKEIPVMDIYKGLPPFTWTAKKDSWDKLLIKSKSTYDPKNPKDEMILVKPIKIFYDVELKQRVLPTAEPYEMLRSRAEKLAQAGAVRMV